MVGLQWTINQVGLNTLCNLPIKRDGNNLIEMLVFHSPSTPGNVMRQIVCYISGFNYM